MTTKRGQGTIENDIGEKGEVPEVFLAPLPAMQRVIFYLAIVITSFLFGCYFDLAGRAAGLSQTQPPNCCWADSINISNFFPAPSIGAITIDSCSLGI